MCSRSTDILEENRYVRRKTAYDKAIEERVVRTLQKTVSRLVDWSSRSSFDTMYLEQDFGRPNGWTLLRYPLERTVIYAW